MAPEFVSERRKQLQTYLDEAMAIPEIASFKELHNFLGIPNYNDETRQENEEQMRRERKRVFKPGEDNPETFLKAIEKAKLDSDRVAEAQAFNALGCSTARAGSSLRASSASTPRSSCAARRSTARV